METQETRLYEETMNSGTKLNYRNASFFGVKKDYKRPDQITNQ